MVYGLSIMHGIYWLLHLVCWCIHNCYTILYLLEGVLYYLRIGLNVHLCSTKKSEKHSHPKCMGLQFVLYSTKNVDNRALAHNLFNTFSWLWARNRMIPGWIYLVISFSAVNKPTSLCRKQTREMHVSVPPLQQCSLLTRQTQQKQSCNNLLQGRQRWKISPFLPEPLLWPSVSWRHFFPALTPLPARSFFWPAVLVYKNVSPSSCSHPPPLGNKVNDINTQQTESTMWSAAERRSDAVQSALLIPTVPTDKLQPDNSKHEAWASMPVVRDGNIVCKGKIVLSLFSRIYFTNKS